MSATVGSSTRLPLYIVTLLSTGPSTVTVLSPLMLPDRLRYMYLHRQLASSLPSALDELAYRGYLGSVR